MSCCSHSKSKNHTGWWVACDDVVSLHTRSQELYIQYGYRAAAVVRALGYPNRHTLKRWAQEFKTDKELHQGYCRVEKYTEDQKQTAITYYVGHGQCASQTVKALGYPSPTVFRRWLNETFPDREKRCVSGKAFRSK